MKIQSHLLFFILHREVYKAGRGILPKRDRPTQLYTMARFFFDMSKNMVPVVVWSHGAKPARRLPLGSCAGISRALSSIFLFYELTSKNPCPQLGNDFHFFMNLLSTWQKTCDTFSRRFRRFFAQIYADLPNFILKKLRKSAQKSAKSAGKVSAPFLSCTKMNLINSNLMQLAVP
jgi:hypothetical protein